MIIYLVLFACGEKQSNEGPNPSDESIQQDATEDSGIDNEDTGADTEQEVEEFLSCGPQRNEQTANLAFDLFTKAMSVEAQGCALEQIDIDNDGDGVVDSSEMIALPSELECDDAGNCEQELPGFAWGWSQSSELRTDYGMDWEDIYEGIVSGRRLIQQGQETIELHLRTKPMGSTATREVVRVFDTSGKMLSEEYYFNDQLWFEVQNTWESGHLVLQTLDDFINSGGQRSTLNWSYDDAGRMQSSSYHRQNGELHSAHFAYDEQGRLIALERQYGEVKWLTQQWNYQDDALVSRTNSFISAYEWHPSGDTALPQSPSDYYSHWDKSIVDFSGDCVLPPVSLFHGYPDAEVIYQLGWSREEVPDRIGFAYGYSGYGWNYGDLSWFGHDGIAGFYGYETWSSDAEISNTITYEEGIMVAETISFNGEEYATRNRQIENGRIVMDEVTSATESGVERKSLVFTYNDAGQLTNRQLQHDDNLIHQSSWSYDSDGNMVEHSITGQQMLSDNDELTHLSTYRQSFTETTDTVTRVREQLNAIASEWQYIDEYREGVHSLGRFEQVEERFVVFDEVDQIVMKGYGNVEEPTAFDTYTLDSDDLLMFWETVTAEGSAEKTYLHSCE